MEGAKGTVEYVVLPSLLNIGPVQFKYLFVHHPQGFYLSSSILNFEQEIKKNLFIRYSDTPLTIGKHS